MTGTNTCTPRRHAAAIKAAVSDSLSKGRYSATRRPARKNRRLATALEAARERRRWSGSLKARRWTRNCLRRDAFIEMGMALPADAVLDRCSRPEQQVGPTAALKAFR